MEFYHLLSPPPLFGPTTLKTLASRLSRHHQPLPPFPACSSGALRYSFFASHLERFLFFGRYFGLVVHQLITKLICRNLNQFFSVAGMFFRFGDIPTILTFTPSPRCLGPICVISHPVVSGLLVSHRDSPNHLHPFPSVINQFVKRFLAYFGRTVDMSNLKESQILGLCPPFSLAVKGSLIFILLKRHGIFSLSPASIFPLNRWYLCNTK